MAVEKSYARLGLFLVVGLVVILATALIFIQRLRSREVIAFAISSGSTCRPRGRLDSSARLGAGCRDLPRFRVSTKT